MSSHHHSSSSPRPLYVMIKPPQPVASSIWNLQQTDKRRASGLLHMTVLPVGDAARLEVWMIRSLCAMLAGVVARPFGMRFDRISGSGRTRSLQGADRAAFMAFQGAVRQALARHGLDLPPFMIQPHVTIDYRSADRNRIMLDEPVCWTVDDFVLVESVHGESRHIEHGRWPLNGGEDEGQLSLFARN